MIAEQPVKTYLVGGAVRDELLGLTPKERDWVVVGATAEAMLEQGFKPVGKDFPVFLHPSTGEEYALARKERKSGHGYAGFSCQFDPTVTLEEDLLRRDLTINAIARDDTGNLIDPYDGCKDLNARLLRHVSDAFVEDPLRVLRVARFAARFAHLGFSVAPQTMDLMRTLARSGELDYLVPERVWQETQRALGEDSPHVYFMTLRECGALSVLFPELDIGTHLLRSLEQAARLRVEPIVRFAVLAHHSATQSGDQNSGGNEIEANSCRRFCDRLRAPVKWRELGELVCKHLSKCHAIESADPATKVNMLEDLDAYRQPERFRQFLSACEADARGRAATQPSSYAPRDMLLNAYDVTAAVSAKDLGDHGLSGPAIGAALHRLRCERLAKSLQEH